MEEISYLNYHKCCLLSVFIRKGDWVDRFIYNFMYNFVDYIITFIKN